MSSSNRVQVASVVEVTLGTTPGTPRMRARRTSGEGLKWVPTFVDSEEIRSDRMNAPPIKTGEDSGGDIKFELSYPFPDSPADVDIRSAMYNAWINTNSRDNDGVADANDINDFNPSSDSDGDNLSDNTETGGDGVYNPIPDSNPLNACDPNPTSSACVPQDLDGDLFFGNYPDNHPKFDPINLP